MKSFPKLVHESLISTPIYERIKAQSAIVLERVARGGGATRWYCCNNESALAEIECLLKPGSVVSFYFDQRMADSAISTEVMTSAENIVIETGELLLGVLSDDLIQIDMEIVTSPAELSEYFSGLLPASRVFYGVFPARDNDGISAITITLPDTDGVMRPHPH